jgi:hypothetical protein
LREMTLRCEIFPHEFLSGASLQTRELQSPYDLAKSEAEQGGREVRSDSLQWLGELFGSVRSTSAPRQRPARDQSSSHPQAQTCVEKWSGTEASAETHQRQQLLFSLRSSGLAATVTVAVSAGDGPGEGQDQEGQTEEGSRMLIAQL